MVVGAIATKLGVGVAKKSADVATTVLKTGARTAKKAAKSGIEITKSAADNVVGATGKVGKTGIVKLGGSSTATKLLVGGGVGIVGGYAAGSLLGSGNSSSKNSVPGILSTDSDAFGADTTLPSDTYKSSDSESPGSISESVLDTVGGVVGAVTGIPSGISSTVNAGIDAMKLIAISGAVIAVMVGGVYVYQNYNTGSGKKYTKKTQYR
jgi:hypothetical protein